MPESFRERVDTAHAIKGILDSYPFGNGILRELLQNSDDAGATSQIFTLDCRTHALESLIDPALSGTQGPSLLSFNNTVFSSSDWEALRTIHGSNKKSDETKIGKFGLGFRSCYHVTEMPYVLSGNVLAIFDPHEHFQPPNDGGVKIDFVREGEHYDDQLAAFQPIVSNSNDFLPGTVVRLPLRTPTQASQSRIKNKSVSTAEIRQLFHQFATTELAVAMLFLKHINSIELREITADGCHISIGKVEIANPFSIAEQRAFARDSQARFETFTCTIILHPSGKPASSPSSRTWRICHSIRDAVETSTVMTKRLGYDIGDLLTKDKLFSHVGLAIPLDDLPETGRLFTVLPLPIYTRFPLHIHAILALTPDRQSLRNIKEIGSSAEDRERFLVEWNLAVFDTFIPPTWERLLRVLVEEDKVPDLWSAWPSTSSSEDSYWHDLPRNLLAEVYSTGSSICPTFSVDGNMLSAHAPLSDALVASPYDDLAVLTALTRATIPIVKPPEHIFQLIESSKCYGLLVDTPTARNALLVHISSQNLLDLLMTDFDPRQTRKFQLMSLSDEDKNVILEYLLLTPLKSGGILSAFRDIIGLPLIRLVNGTFVELCAPVQGYTTYILVSAAEASLFGNSNNEMIALSAMSSSVQALFCNPNASRAVNVAALSKDHVSHYLHTLFGHFNPALDEVDGADAAEKLPWLVLFWAWMDSCAGALDILPLIYQFHLLPTRAKTLRKVQSGFLLSASIDPQTVAILDRLGVPFLHTSVAFSPSGILASKGIGRPAEDISFVLDHITSSVFPSLTHQAQARRSIKVYFVHCLQYNIGGSAITLQASQRETYLSLPIFPTFVPNDKGRFTKANGPAVGQLIFVKDGCLLPIQPTPSTYISVSGSDRVLALLINPRAVRDALDELKALEISIPILKTQPPDLLDELSLRIISRILDLPQHSLQQLKLAPFVSVGGDQRRAPRDIIDPGSEIAPLYYGESDRFPTGPFNISPYLDILQFQGFFTSTLTPELALERIEYVSRSSDVSKAKVLLQLLDKHWSKSFSLPALPPVAWLPTKGGTLCRADQCRDIHDNAFLFDLVLSIVDIKLSSVGLRSALGWTDSLPFDDLQAQFLATLSGDNVEKRGERLITLIKYISKRHSRQELSVANIDSLRENLRERAWIPVAPDIFVSTGHAILSQDVRETASFKKVPRSLLEESALNFLMSMGCTERPTPENILAELEFLFSTAPTTSTGPALILLEELSRSISGQVTIECRARIFVPDSQCVLRNIDEVYYDDMGRSGGYKLEHPQILPTHALLSKSLARTLAIRFLSSLELGDDEEDEDDENDEDMREELTTRISNVLIDYDICYALNEFAANAADAKASEFSMLLDERSFETDRLLSPEMAEFQRAPSLILHNDAAFSAKDFVGLRKIGESSKAGVADAIGRFGLGALSMYHFTDVPMVVSGGFVMFLDPSGTRLPSLKGRARTTLRRKLGKFSMKYPDHISPLDSLFGFSMTSASDYKGTLFRLPLRSSASCLSTTLIRSSDCLNLLNGPFNSLAHDAFFFSKLNRISASHRLPLTEPIGLWEFVAERKTKSLPTNGYGQEVLRLKSPKDISQSTEDWLITSTASSLVSVPEEHMHVLETQKLASTETAIVVGLALCVSEPPVPRNMNNHHLFSTLRLPNVISLPVHLHAQFALASDRRGIRFDPPDSNGKRVSQSSYNSWILTSLVPPLYLFTLECVATHENSHRDNSAWWPSIAKDPISEEVGAAFYHSLSESSMLVCYTVSRGLISPRAAVFSLEEPRAVTDILKLLKPPNVVRLPQALRRIVTLNKSLKTVTTKFVATVLQLRSEELQRLFISHRIKIHDLDVVVHYLLKDGISVLNLPLLVLNRTTPSPVLFEGHGRPSIYCSYAPPHIFPGERFLHIGYEHSTVKLLISEKELNVKNFDNIGALALVRDMIHPNPRALLTPAEARWIRVFWECYAELPGPPSPSALSDLPLLPTHQPQEFISIDYLRQAPALPEPHGFQLQWLIPIAIKLNILVFKTPVGLGSFTKDDISLKSFLECIGPQNQSLSALSRHEREQLAQWIRGQLRTQPEQFWTLPSHLKDTLSLLPVWCGREGRSPEQLLAAVDLKMLPGEVSIDTISHYLRHDVAVATYSAELNIMASHLGHALMTTSELLETLLLPPILPTAELRQFRALVLTILSLQVRNADEIPIKVPNGHGTLTPVNQLYDHSVEVLSSAFQRTEMESFIHAEFRDLQPLLRDLGLQHEVTFPVFLQCAISIHNDLEEHGLPEVDVLARALIVHTYYCTIMPSRIMTRSDQWQKLDRLRFVPRLSSERHRRTPYDILEYCNHLPIIVCPNDIVRRQDEAVAWTRRGLCLEEPPTELVAVNPTYGIPQVDEVVDHLAVLALRIAKDHPGSDMLLADLRATYDWLNSHSVDARSSLLCYEDEALFLNVDNPSSETWEWRSAPELVFGLHYDETNLFGVRNFLQNYKPLLLAAGANTLSTPVYEPGQAVEEPEEVTSIRATFNEMRMEGQLTDIVLKPTLTPEPAPMEKLRAHASFLAAAVPHIRTALRTEMMEARNFEYCFEGSLFSARAILEFVYTGDPLIEDPLSDEGAMDLLRDLLELLDVVEAWGMQRLKAKVEWLIAYKYSLVTPMTYRMILEHSERYNAISLAKFCRDFQKSNQPLLQALSN